VADADVLEAAAVVVLDAAVHGGYAVDLDVLDSAARAFQQASDSLGTLGLPPTVTTSADTHSALASVVTDALGTAATSLAGVGGRLRAMADNYRQVEALLTQALESVGAAMTDGTGLAALILPALVPPALIPSARSGIGHGGVSGRTSLAGDWEAAGVAVLLGASAAHDMPGFGLAAVSDPDQLRNTAADWFATAESIDDHQQAAAAAADAVSSHCVGPAVDAFREKTAGLFTGSPSGGETVEAGAPMMDQLSACCRLLGRVHDAAAAVC
jgi:hypothetical protein